MRPQTQLVVLAKLDPMLVNLGKVRVIVALTQLVHAGGFGAEIVATISSRCFLRLESPPVRVTGQDTPFPLVMEPLYLPSTQVSWMRQSSGTVYKCFFV
jgi:pyruvate/2-oxoglutarate/acetoin dehydrogenase E1 component